MRLHLRLASEALPPGGRYVMVIGNSRTQDHTLPVHNAIVSLAAASGLQLERAFAYRIRRHYMKFPRQSRGGIILLDWILVLRKTGIPGGGEPLPVHSVTLAPSAVAN
jgi:hypothetical protein